MVNTTNNGEEDRGRDVSYEKDKLIQNITA